MIVLVVILGVDSMAHGQYVRSCGAPSPLTPVSGTGVFFSVTPSLCVSERYDSNVFYAPPTPGLQRDDFVTNVNPMLRVNHNGDYASGILNLGGFSETFVKNSDLNYLGTRDSLLLNLDKSIKRLFPDASLRVMDIFNYTPLPPGFDNPVAGTSPSDPGYTQDVFAQGILFRRVNNLSNTGTVSTSYATTALTSLHASYTHSMIRFQGAPPTTGGVNLFNTTTQTGTVGGAAQMSELDTLQINYSHAQIDYTRDPISSSFKIDSVIPGWSRTLTPNLKAEVGGGVIKINPGITTYAANAALIMNFLNNSATMSYSHSAFPSYIAVVPTIMVGDVFLLSAVHKIGRQWQLSETGSYAHRSGGSGINSVTYTSYRAGVDLYYWVNSIWSTALSYEYSNFSSDAGTSNTSFDRQVITLSVKAAWE